MTVQEQDTLRSLIAAGDPFGAYILPGETTLRLSGLHVKTWPGSAVDAVPAPVTPRAVYLSAVRTAIDSLRRRPAGDKTVLARNISGSFCTFDPVSMASEYFPEFPDCLRFLIFSPEYGFWMGATPELLLTETENKLQARALAGTRPVNSPGDWSEKNMNEHLTVRDEIISQLRRAGLNITVQPQTFTLPYGTVEHLCTDFVVDKPAGFDSAWLADLLHPTPAVVGFPRSTAMEEISVLESSPRKLYGGVMKVDLPDRKIFYVMLRCVHFNRTRWSIYTGSGITAASEAEMEWEETENKATPLLNILSKFSSEIE